MTRRGLVTAGVVSLLLHGAAVWALLPRGGGRTGIEAPPLIEIELVDQAAQIRGTIDATPGQPPPEPETPPAPQDQAGSLPPPPPPTRPVAPGPPARAAVNLAGADQDQEPLSVTGRDVVPPRPDGVRNKPPAYPADAARRRAEGTVGLRIHVTEAGTPAWVDVVASSGDASLDRAAREAVALWRFQPARNNGGPVPFDFEYRIRFTLGAQQ